MSVLVPVRNEEAFLQVMIDTMSAQELEESVEFLLMDGRSSDSTGLILESAARADPRIRVIDNPGRTIPRALNAGLRLARGDIVARMDAHALYPVNYLAAGVARLRKGDVACVSAPVRAVGLDTWSRRIAVALGTWLGTGGATFRRPLHHEIDVDRGFGGVWHRDTLLEYGGWDEDSPINEDSELAARIREAGGRIVCIPELTASYIPRNSLTALARQYLRFGYYRARTTSLHRTSFTASHALPPAIVITTCAAVLAPRPVAALARSGVLAYATALVWVSAGSTARVSRSDACALPFVFVTMHFAWGAGFLCGFARFGPTLASQRVRNRVRSRN